MIATLTNHRRYGQFGSTPSLVRALTSFGSLAVKRLWLKADAITAHSDGDALATWVDATSFGNNATQASGPAQPIYKTGIQNSLPAVRFDGSSAFMSLPDFSAFTGGEAWVVLKTNADPQPVGNETKTCPPLGDFGTDAFGDHYPYTDGVVYYDFGSTARKTVGDPTPSLASWHILNLISVSGEWTLNINNAGTPTYTTATNTVAFNSTPLLGKSTGSLGPFFFAGDIGEVMLYDAKLSSAQRSSDYSYLYNKWFPAAGGFLPRMTLLGVG